MILSLAQKYLIKFKGFNLNVIAIIKTAIDITDSITEWYKKFYAVALLGAFSFDGVGHFVQQIADLAFFCEKKIAKYYILFEAFMALSFHLCHLIDLYLRLPFQFNVMILKKKKK